MFSGIIWYWWLIISSETRSLTTSCVSSLNLSPLYVRWITSPSLPVLQLCDVFVLLCEAPAAEFRCGSPRLIFPVLVDALHWTRWDGSWSPLSCPHEELLSSLVVCKMELRPEWGQGIWPADLLEEGESGRGLCVLFPAWTCLLAEVLLTLVVENSSSSLTHAAFVFVVED